MKGKWSALPGDVKREMIDFGGGINLSEAKLALKENEASESMNISSANYPALSVRSRRSKYNKSLPMGIAEYFGVLANGDLCAVFKTESGEYCFIRNIDSGADLGAFKSELPLSAVELFVEREDKRVTVFGTSTGSASIFDETGKSYGRVGFLPRNFMIMHNNMLVGADINSNMVHIAKQGDFVWIDNEYDYFHVEGENPKCRGLASYRGYLLYFSEDSLYQILGDKPFNRQVKPLSHGAGCVSYHTIAQVEGNLLWLAKGGVYEWNGGARPALVSKKVEKYVANIDMDKLIAMPAAVAWRNCYYLAIVPKTGEPLLLVYDVIKKAWNMQSTTGIVRFARRGNSLYGIDTKGDIYDMANANSNETIEWNWISAPLRVGTFADGQVLKKLTLLLEIKEEGANVNCSVILDSGEGITIMSADYSTEKMHELVLPLDKVSNSTMFQIKLFGCGDVVIHGLEKTIRKRR